MTKKKFEQFAILEKRIIGDNGSITLQEKDIINWNKVQTAKWDSMVTKRLFEAAIDNGSPKLVSRLLQVKQIRWGNNKLLQFASYAAISCCQPSISTYVLSIKLI